MSDIVPGAVPLFHHSNRNEANAEDGSGAAPPASLDVQPLFDHFSGLSCAQRAAELLTAATSIPDDTSLIMDTLFAQVLPGQQTQTGLSPPSSPDGISWEQRPVWITVRNLLADSFQALEFSRLVCRVELTDPGRGITYTTYVITADGNAALQERNVAEVVARRLRD